MLSESGFSDYGMCGMGWFEMMAYWAIALLLIRKLLFRGWVYVVVGAG